MIPNPLLAILKLFLNYKNYVEYRHYIDAKESTALYKLLDLFMEKYQKDISLDEFCVLVQAENNDFKLELDLLKSIEVSDEILLDLVEQYKKQTLAHEIALIAIDVSEGKKSFAALSDKITSNADSKPTLDIKFVTDNLEELYENRVRKHGLRWRLNTLNRMLGSLRKGDFGFLFARPETGKTTFLASEVSHFSTQLQEDSGPILWLNNEEDGEKVQLRIYQATLALPLAQLYHNVLDNREQYAQLTKNKIKLVDQASISKNQVEKLCKILQPSLIIFDQLDKIKGFDGDREDLRLGSIYQWARELAKTYCPVIAVSQADGSGEGKKWLTMENVANAKTAKQAEADWILGIGATHSDGFEYVRHLHLSKNKLDGDEDTDPTLRHGKCDVLIKPDIARYEDYT